MNERQVNFSARSCGLLLLVFFSALAFSISFGNYHPVALGLYLALLACGLGVLFFFRSSHRSVSIVWGLVLVLALCWYHLFLLSRTFRILYPTAVAELISMAQALARLPLVGLALFFAIWRSPWPRLKRWILLLIMVDLSFGILRSFAQVVVISPKPFIDVWYIFQQSGLFLLEGVNPYNADYVNLYPGSPWYPEGKADFYAYPPLTLALNVLGLFVGDIRWIFLACHVLGGVFIFWVAHRARLPLVEAFALMIMVLAVPNAHFVIEQSWNEPYIALALGIFSLLLQMKKLRLVLFFGGIIIALKQTMILFFALFLGHVRRWNATKLFWFGLAGVVSFGIFLAIDPEAIWHDTVTHFRQTPFRPEALSILAYLHAEWGLTFNEPPNAASAFVLVLGCTLGAAFLWRRNQGLLFEPGRVSRFWLTFALSYLAFVLVSKQAFTNYFYLIHVIFVHALLWSRLEDAGGPDEPAGADGISP